MPRKWNDERLKWQYDHVKNYAKSSECAFTDEELSTHYLDKLSHQTKSHRIMRMISLAYYLGWLRGIAYVDEMKTPISMD
jgi:hypothetical protein